VRQRVRRMECYSIKSKATWVVRWHVSYDPYSYYVRFEEWMGTEDNKIVRLTKTEPKMRDWKCVVYEAEDGINELAMLLSIDRPRVVFATGKIPERLKDVLRRLPPSTYYLAVM
jgi:hypothetical protein